MYFGPAHRSRKAAYLSCSGNICFRGYLDFCVTAGSFSSVMEDRGALNSPGKPEGWLLLTGVPDTLEQGHLSEALWYG